MGIREDSYYEQSFHGSGALKYAHPLILVICAYDNEQGLTLKLNVHFRVMLSHFACEIEEQMSSIDRKAPRST